jgi:hypothetical protein
VMWLLMFGSGNVGVAGGSRMVSLLPRSALAFVLGCFVFAFTGVARNNSIGSDSASPRLGGAGGVRRQSNSHDPSLRL